MKKFYSTLSKESLLCAKQAPHEIIKVLKNTVKIANKVTH